MASIDQSPGETVTAIGRTASTSTPAMQAPMNFRAAACKLAAYALACGAGAAAMFAFSHQPAVPARQVTEIAMQATPVVSEYAVPEPPAEQIPAEKIPTAQPEPASVINEVSHEEPVSEPANLLHTTGTTEPAPGRYAKLPLATSQAIAFVDVKAGDRIKKGWQVFSHWESPDRLQAVKTELERTKKLGEVAKARCTAAIQNVERLKKLQGSVSAQNLQDAQTNASVRQSEYEAAQLAIAQAESHFTAMEFEFTQAFVTSPIDGVVVSVDVVPGERRQLNGPFRGVTVLDTTVLYCRCLLDQQELAKLQRLGRVGGEQSAAAASTESGTSQGEIQVAVEFDGQDFAAKVVWIGLQADAATGHIPVLLEVSNPKEILRSGVSINVCFRGQ